MARSHGNSRKYCWDNFLSNNTLEVCASIVVYLVNLSPLFPLSPSSPSLPLSLSLFNSLPPQLLRNMKSQFTGLLYETGFIPSSDPRHSSANVNSDNMKLVKAVLCAGLYPNVFKVDQTKPGRSVHVIYSLSWWHC